MPDLSPTSPLLEMLETRTFLSSPTAGQAPGHPFNATVVSVRKKASRKQRAKVRGKAPKAVISYRAAALFPLVAGATWTYRSGTETVEQAVDGTPTLANGLTTARLLTTRHGETIADATLTSGDNGIRLLRRDLMSPGSTDSESFAGGMPLLLFTMRSGAKAAFKVKWQGVQDSGGFVWTGADTRKLEVIGLQTLTVPAGSFKAMLVRQTRTATQSQTGHGPLTVALSTRTDSWYAPGIGLVRSVVTTRRTASFNNVAVESTTTRKVTDLLATNQTYVPPRPELVSALRQAGSVAAVAGRKLTLESVVRNLGQESARPSTVTLYFSPDRTVDFTDAAAGGGRIRALAPGQSQVRNIKLQLPRQPGTYFVATFADAAQEVDEPNRDNNWSAALKVVVRKR